MLFQFALQTDTRNPFATQSGSINFGSVLGVVLLLLIVMLLIIAGIQTAYRAMTRTRLDQLDPKRLAEMWSEIEKTSQHGLMGAKLAVVEADKLLDTVLRKMHIPGETMGERLKVAAYKYPAISRVWPAHKLRNQLVHDATFEITQRQARSALKDFRDAFKALNVF